MPRHPSVQQSLRCRGTLRFRLWDPFTRKDYATYTATNTITNWGINAIAAFLAGQFALTAATPAQLSLPTYLALGTGTGTAQVTDLWMAHEVYGTRLPLTSAAVSTNTALLSVTYTSIATSQSWSEAGLWDQAPDTATVAQAVSAGSTTLTVLNAPAVLAGQPIYINDPTNPEYNTIAQAASAGTVTWALTTALQYAHAANTPIVIFNGHLWNHVILPSAFSQLAGQALTVDWTLAIS